MQVTVNGVAEEVAAGTTVDSLVSSRAEGHRHVAVAVNGAVVPRGDWPAATLRSGDSVEVLAAVAGG